MAGLASTSAYAADAVIYEPPAPAPVYQEVPIFSWNGGYIGLQGGGLWSDSNVNGDLDVFDADEGVFGDSSTAASSASMPATTGRPAHG